MHELDKNFDDLIGKLASRVYDTEKGNWRLQLLKQDLAEFVHVDDKLSIWDAGCGFAQISLWLAQAGHHLTLCDISEKMLQQAKQHFSDASLQADFYHESAQDVAARQPQFDLVLFHAVIEWMAEPIDSLDIVLSKVKRGGYLSLLFYNRNAMVYANVLKGQWRLKPILEDRYIGKGNKLSPPNPQFPHEIEQHLNAAGFDIKAHTGIRVFHDYLSDEIRDKTNNDELFELEARYCRLPIYRDMGRYVHLLAKKR